MEKDYDGPSEARSSLYDRLSHGQVARDGTMPMMPPSVTPAPTPVIGIGLDQNDKLIGILKAELEQLSGRLAPVLQQQNTNGAGMGADAKTPVGSSSIALALARQRDNLLEVIAVVRFLRNSVEV